MDTQKNLNIKTFTLTLLGVILLWLPVLWLHLTIVLFSALTVYGLTLAIDNALQKFTQNPCDTNSNGWRTHFAWNWAFVGRHGDWGIGGDSIKTAIFG